MFLEVFPKILILPWKSALDIPKLYPRGRDTELVAHGAPGRLRRDRKEDLCSSTISMGHSHGLIPITIKSLGSSSHPHF